MPAIFMTSSSLATTCDSDRKMTLKEMTICDSAYIAIGQCHVIVLILPFGQCHVIDRVGMFCNKQMCIRSWCKLSVYAR